jgi:hypothetical protein
MVGRYLPDLHRHSDVVACMGQAYVGRQLADPVISAEAGVTLMTIILVNLWAFVLRTRDIAYWL